MSLIKSLNNFTFRFLFMLYIVRFALRIKVFGNKLDPLNRSQITASFIMTQLETQPSGILTDKQKFQLVHRLAKFLNIYLNHKLSLVDGFRHQVPGRGFYDLVVMPALGPLNLGEPDQFEFYRLLHWCIATITIIMNHSRYSVTATFAPIPSKHAGVYKYANSFSIQPHPANKLDTFGE